MDFLNFLKSTFVGLFFALSLIQLAACQQSKESNGKAVMVKSKPGAQGKPQAKTGTPSGSLSKVGAGGDEKPLAVGQGKATPQELEAKWVLLNMQILNQSHQFFSESWKLLMKDPGLRSKSVFSVTLRRLQDLYDEKGVIKESKSQGRSCTGTDLKDVVVITKGTDSFPQRLDLESQDCNGKRQSITASFYLEPKSGVIQMSFNPVNLLEGAGTRLNALANTQAGFRIPCLVNFTTAGRVSMLSCRHLGQTVSTEKHLQFEYFNYNRQSDKILEVRSIAYGSDFATRSPTECEKIILVPLTGPVTVHENCPAGSPSKVEEEKALEPSSPLKKPEALPGTPGFEEPLDMNSPIADAAPVATAKVPAPASAHAEKVVDATTIGDGREVVPAGIQR